jgi:hypothetical protein
MASFTQFVLGGTILADNEDPPLHGPIVIELYSKDSSIALVLYDLGTYVFMFMLVAVLVVLTLLLFKLGALHAHRAEQGLEALDVFQILGTGFDVQAARRLEQLGNEIPTTMCAGRLQPVVPCCNVLYRVAMCCTVLYCVATSPIRWGHLGNLVPDDDVRSQHTAWDDGAAGVPMPQRRTPCLAAPRVRRLGGPGSGQW